MVKRIVPWLAWIASVFISDRFYRGCWVVGPVFGAAFLAAHFDQIKKGLSIRHAVFLGSSTLTYALVYWIAENGGWRFEQDMMDMLFGSITTAIVVGSLLMPFLHGMIFPADLKTVRRVSLGLILSWYAVQIIAMIDDAANIPGHIDYLLIAIALWQGIYIRFLKL